MSEEKRSSPLDIPIRLAFRTARALDTVRRIHAARERAIERGLERLELAANRPAREVREERPLRIGALDMSRRRSPEQKIERLQARLESVRRITEILDVQSDTIQQRLTDPDVHQVVEEHGISHADLMSFLPAAKDAEVVGSKAPKSRPAAKPTPPTPAKAPKKTAKKKKTE